MIDIGDIQVADEYIAFEFDDHVNANGMFTEEQESDVIIMATTANHKDSASRARWATVIKAGPKVKDPEIKQGARILIENLRWSLRIPIPGKLETFHVTKECEILAIEEES